MLHMSEQSSVALPKKEQLSMKQRESVKLKAVILNTARCTGYRKVGKRYCKVGFALGFQHFPRDLGNVNEWKIMFDPSIKQPGT